jgi:hypothetical protein
MLGQEPYFPETAWVEMTLRPPLQPLVIQTDHTNPPRLEAPAHTENPSCTRRLLMFRDSYAIYWLPYFGHNFRHVTYIWDYWDRSLIEREQPDVVVDELLERHLYDTNPRQLRQRDEIPSGIKRVLHLRK